MDTKFSGVFKSVQQIAEAFNVELEGLNILAAHYGGYGSDDWYYEMEAWVLFHDERGLFEVRGSHCSCYGLEGQWEPDATSVEALRYRVLHGRFVGFENNEIENILARICVYCSTINPDEKSCKNCGALL